MSWVTFNVKLPDGSTVPDGQVNFNWAIANAANSPITGTVSYRHEDHGEGRVILRVTGAPASANGTYTFVDELFGPQDGVNIPPVPGSSFTGGDYHTLGGILFKPSATDPHGSGKLSAIFSNPNDTDDTCSWDASVTTPIPHAVKKAAY